jgi:flagellar basal-body rod modification protein FlgD
MADALWAAYTPVSEKTSSAAAIQTTTKSNDELDKNAFLKLLVTQMQYQDPLNPVDDKEFISQMAQFSSLEQMQNLNQTMTGAQTFALVGKYVAATLYNGQTGSYTEASGRVDSVAVKNKTPYLVVDGADVPLSSVTDVFEDEFRLNAERANSANAFMSQNIALIGKFIQAITLDGDGEATGFVEGEVEYVKLSSGSPVLVVNGADVFPSELISVGDEYMILGKTIKTAETRETEDGGTETVYADHAVTAVEINGGEAVLALDNGDRIPIDKINTVTEALRFVGEEIKIADKSGVAAGVFISDKVLWMLFQDGSLTPFSAVIR